MRDNLRRIPAAFLGVAAAAALLFMALGIGPVLATDPTPASTPAASGSPTRSNDRTNSPGRIRGNTVLGDLIVVDNEGITRHLRMARGTINAIDSDSIALLLASGDNVTFAISSNTRFRDRGKSAEADDFVIGNQVMVIGEKSGDSYAARVVRHALTAEQKTRIRDRFDGASKDHPRLTRFLWRHPNLWGGLRGAGPADSAPVTP